MEVTSPNILRSLTNEASRQADFYNRRSLTNEASRQADFYNRRSGDETEAAASRALNLHHQFWSELENIATEARRKSAVLVIEMRERVLFPTATTENRRSTWK